MKYLPLLILFLIPSLLQAADIPTLQETNVTLRTNRGQGSGTVFTRDGHTFVWTAAHVVDAQRRSSKIDDKTIVEFDDVNVIQEIIENGRRVGEINVFAEVLKFSPKEDLAVLRIRKMHYTDKTTVFWDGVPELGTDLYHVGSLLGQMGANSLTTGIVSQVGRVYRGDVYDQTTVTAFPGSSGGGVYHKETGEYVGMLVRGAGETFNLIVPVRRMREWAESEDCLWAIDTEVPIPFKWPAVEDRIKSSRPQPSDLPESIKTLFKCNCGPDCPCGDDCQCGPECPGGSCPVPCAIPPR